MSYCRFSSDNFGCDVYIYGSQYGYELHIAGNRVIGDVPKLTDLLGNPEEFLKSHKAQMDFLDTAKRERIKLPYSGESFTFSEPIDLLEKLKELKSLGYRIPKYVFEEIEEEIKQEGICKNCTDKK